MSTRTLPAHEEMLDAFKEACWLKPDWPEAHYNLGLGYMVVGMYEDALEPLKEAVDDVELRVVGVALVVEHQSHDLQHSARGRECAPQVFE